MLLLLCAGVARAQAASAAPVAPATTTLSPAAFKLHTPWHRRHARRQRFFLSSHAWIFWGAAAGAGMGAGLAGPQTYAAQRARVALAYGAMGGIIAGALQAWRTRPRLQSAEARWPRPLDWGLMAGIAGVQTMDYFSTRDFRRQQRSEWLLTNAIVDRRGELIATEAAAALAGMSIAWLLHRAGHDGWARMFSLAYIGAGCASYINNRRYARTGSSWF